MSEKFGPINIFEDDTHFLIRIHPENRDRARRIPGRQWDGLRKVWVCPKTVQAYNAITLEFGVDADDFDIDKPDSRTAATPPTRPQTQNPHISFRGCSSEDELVPDFHLNKDLNVEREMVAIRGLIESLKSQALEQQNSLEEIQQSQLRSEDILAENLKPSKAVKARQVLPNELKLSRKKDIILLEKTIVTIARSLSNDEIGFMNVIGSESLLALPEAFIASAHEQLKNYLEIYLCDSQKFDGFYSLIKHLDRERIIFQRKDDTIRVLDSLHMMNNHRNNIVHSGSSFSEIEKWSRTIIYILTLALVWTRIASSEGSD